MSRRRLRARDRVEFVRVLESRRRRKIVVGAERDDENVAIVVAGVGRHPPGGRIDGDDRLAQEAHAGLDEVS